VLLSHANIANNVSAVLSVFTLEPDDRSLSFLPWAHAFGQTVELHALLASGCSTGFAESVPKIVDNLSEVQPTMLVSVPRIFTKIYDGLNKMMVEKGGATKVIFDAAMSNAAKRRTLASRGESSRWLEAQHALFDRVVFEKVRERFGGRLKYAISGGAAIPVEVAEFIDALGITVYEGYGLSETSPIATANWQGTRRIGSVGKPIPGVRVEIDVAQSADPRDGEIVVFGHNVMQGYHNLPEETKKVFTDQGGFRTGDLGRFDEDGFLYITGRVKEQYKLANGKYVVPTPIEDKLSLSPYFASIMIYGDNRPFNIALVVPDREAVGEWAGSRDLELNDSLLAENPAVLELIESEVNSINQSLKGYERIKKHLVIDEDFTTENGMLTPTLKVKRRVVLDRYGDAIESLYE
jgi:long-chain acyl-CoA synthetase